MRRYESHGFRVKVWWSESESRDEILPRPLSFHSDAIVFLSSSIRTYTKAKRIKKRQKNK